MSVSDIVEQFTDDGFTLIVYDMKSETEIYHGPASEVYYEDIGDLEVMSIDPPEKAWEITLNVEMTDDNFYDEAEEESFDIF